MYRFWVLGFLLVLVGASDVLAQDRHGRGRRGRVVVGGHRPAVRSVGRSPRYFYSRPSYRRHYRSYAPPPRYYCQPRRIVSRSRSVSVGFSYRRSAPSYYVAAPVVVAPVAPIVYVAPSYMVGDYRVGQYVGGGDYKFKFVGPDGRLCKAKVDDGIIEKIELD